MKTKKPKRWSGVLRAGAARVLYRDGYSQRKFMWPTWIRFHRVHVTITPVRRARKERS